MTAAPHALRRLGAVALTFALTATVLVGLTTESHGQSSPEFSDLDQTIHAEAIRLVAEDGITRGFPDGTFRPRDDVRRDQMATFIAAALQLAPRTPDFPDVSSDSVHAGAIGAIAHADITRGFPDGTYRPRGFVTRGQMATFLAEGLDLPPGRATFTDVPSTYVHADAIAALADSGITEGYPDGTFRPNALVKRDQMAAFLARGIPLPRVPECPGSQTASTSSTESTDDSSAEAPDEGIASTADTTTVDRGSEDLVELESGDLLDPTEPEVTANAAAEDTKLDLGPAIPGVAFPLTSVISTTNGNLEVHSQDLTTSRGARVDTVGDVTATTTIPAGRRTWATARIGNDVYAGQWGVTAGSRNLYRYSTTAGGDRVATAVATVPTGNEFWALTADPSGRLWAGTRAHADSAFRETIGLGNGRGDGRHVVHRIDPSTGRVTNVTICLPNPPGTAAGLRPDIKQLAAVGSTLYVGTGQQSGGARLYAFEPGDRDDVQAGEVRDLTPAAARSATGVFALAASDKWIAFGTQAGSGQTARLVVIHRNSEGTRVNMPLSDASGAAESRVDAVAIRGDRIVATGFSGTVYDVTASTSGSVRTRAPFDSERLEPPVDGQFHRFVSIQDGGTLRGVTQQGVVWTRAANGDVDRVNLVDTGAPVAPGLPHSLHVGSEDVAVGANSVITLRPTASPEDESRTVNITGEAKAMTSDAAGNTYIASYPNAGLWRIDAGGDEAELRRSWTANFRRPAGADFDDRPVGGRVNVIARDDNAPQTDPRTTPQANFQFRPSQLFSMNPNQTTRASGRALGRGGSHTSTVTAATSAARPVEASALHNDDTLGGVDAFVGDTFGGVQRVSTANGDRKWYQPAAAGQGDRRVVDIQLVDGTLVVVQTGAIRHRDGTVHDAMTIVREIDPENGAVLSSSVVRTTSNNSFAVGDAVTSGDVTVMTTRSSLRYFDRSTETHYGVAFDDRNDSFGGPYVDIDRTACQLYSFEQTPSHLVRQPPPGVFEEAACPSGIDLPVGDDS